MNSSAAGPALYTAELSAILNCLMAERQENSVGTVETRFLRVVNENNPLQLECGKTLGPIDVAYETYGKLNQAEDNAVLICHALSGNAHVAGFHSADDKKAGWWDDMVGPGKGIDTNKYFVICSNFLGGCRGTTGPSSISPRTKRPYGLEFPMITIADMVRVQKLLLDKLDIRKLLAVIGGSMGGMQVLQWAIEYPDFVRAAAVIGTTTHLGAQAIAFDAVGRNAILADSNFANGQYSDTNSPDRGLAIARMIGHVSYLSEQAMRNKFGRKLTSKKYTYDFNSEFAVETYLDYQGQSFVERFDANSYLYLTKAMDYFDLKKEYGSLTVAFKNVKSRFLVISFTSDWLFPPSQSKTIVDALVVNNKDVSYCNIESPYGHDSFLLEPKKLGLFISSFLDATSQPGIRQSRPPASITKHSFSQYEQARRARVDYELIESLIEPDSRVLDIGCGDGELLANLTADKNITGKGIEIQEDLVLVCVSRGLSIIQHDAEQGLENYADKSFDYVILSQTVQTVNNPKKLLEELLRIGRKVIVSFPNFANWRCRAQLLFRGKAPVSKQLPFDWHNSPNRHFLSLRDFDEFCSNLGVRVEKRIPLIKTYLSPVRFAPNFFAEQAIFVVSRD